MKHVVKSWSHFFQAIKAGNKLHDLRKNDRNFKLWDKLELNEYDPFLGKYTGEKFTVEICFITGEETPCAFSSAVLEKGYVILSIRRCPE